MTRIYIIGLAILIIAIIANGMILKIGIKSWYGFIEMLGQNGFSAFKSLTLLDWVWLFIGYPFILGCGYIIGDKLYSWIF
ncbi:hypothetical protein SAMN04487989_10910 [Bizionia echini]|uniref:Uncharacterized protein n=1 Tax=Bizionia echini TaxID=649333 RepID=A0A1I5DM48_9FLAO|nr:hypothetical protein [Bizionia echini]SFO00302.1 hypothetical protein SAMN04487989_10910 [Bizionia echini]|tara:strand:+ start:474 stop:713 length:240 start_codon:yes stop_codon:yes gene_type:complete